MACLSELEGLGSAKGLVGRIKELYNLISGSGFVTDISGTVDEIDVSDNGDGTFTVGLPDSVTITLDLTVGNDVNVGGDIYIEEDNKIIYDN